MNQDQAGESGGDGATILLVEDERALRSSIREALEYQGYKIHEAEDGTDAVHVISRLQEPPDLLITDLLMPGMRGDELADYVLRHYPCVRIIFMSAHRSEFVLARDALHGSVFLQKPFRLKMLVQAVRDLLGKS